MEGKCLSDLPTEILGLFLRNVGQRDLLTSRLVCRSWNEECEKTIQKRKSEFFQTLTETNISEYINFVSDTECFLRKVSIPFHLEITLIPGDSDDLYRISLNKLGDNVDSLTALFGEECITKLTLKTKRAGPDTDTTFAKHWFIEFLIKLSSGLKILDLTNYVQWFGDDAELTTKLVTLRFPKLNTLTCHKCNWVEYPSLQTDQTSFLQCIIEGSLNLERIKHVDNLDLIQLPIKYDIVKTLLIEGDITTNHSEILEKFRQSKSSAIQEIGFNLERCPHREDAKIITNILEFVSATLKSLTITAMVTHNDNTKIARAQIMGFPRLPHLQHLRIDSYAVYDDLIYLDPQEINFNQATLPSLKSVEFPLGFILSSESSLREDPEEVFKLLTVNELTVRLNHSRWPVLTCGIEFYKRGDSLRHLQRVFPNMSKLCIVNEYIKAIEQQCVKPLLKHLIQSPLSRNIHQIDIIGFEEGFLGQLLGQFGGETDVHAGTDGTFYLTNVRKLRLGLPNMAHSSSNGFLPVPNLIGIAKSFPALQIIEVSEILLRGLCDKERKELIQALASTFPYLWIHVI